MSTEVTMNDTIAVPALDDALVDSKQQHQPDFLHSPPDSNKVHKSDASDSELSDLDEEPILSDAPEPAPPSDPPQEPEQEQGQEEAHGQDQNQEEEQDDIGEVLPDHYSGTVPVFKPTMDQFKDFKRFMKAVDSYGMKSGIIKIIPPQEWKDSLPAIDDLVKQVKVREPIKQDIMGSNGTYRQVNILHGRSYNLPQWRQLCDQSEHQPPARRGERRANAEKARTTRSRAAAPKPANPETPKKRGRGRAPKGRGRGRPKKKQEDEEEDRPMTPVSPKVETEDVEEKPVESIEKDPGVEVDEDEPAPTVGRMGGMRQAKPQMQSVSARRKYSRREGSAMIDEAAFKDWDYKMDISEYTPERCEELERVYWKTLTYAPPLYGADLMGTLFHEDTELWNLNKLPNLLDVLGTKVPGVNTAYLYLGMWKATFAWHLEDVDLYSINYLHFGAPKQWYSISQADARRFELAMKSIWPTDAKACDQFLRHKAFLISPQHLLSHFNIKVNKCLSYPGEFVVTYPYGYHSGYNLGYNCAEAVNFALDSWLEMGKIAKKCDCAQAQDSVWVNVYEIERKLRGEETEEEETEDEEEDEDEDDDEISGLPTPPASHGVKFKVGGLKRKRGPGGKSGKVKKIKLRIKSKVEPPCCLCPHDNPTLELLPTDDGRKAHRMCALYLPETFIETVDGKEVVSNVTRIHKDRLDLKCLYCRSKKGACFQCSQKRCARAYHATCAAAAGVFVEEEEVPVFGEDGTEYKEQAFEFSCRFHRTKRDRKLDGEALENDSRIRAAAAALKKGKICQLQYHKGEIFAGFVVENRYDEQTLLIDILPTGDRLEVEWKWLLLPDPADYHLPKASANAIPMPTERSAKDKLNAKRSEDDKPRKDDIFAGSYTWAEFQLQDVKNQDQVKVDFSKPDQIWHYLGKTSTEARAQYTEDPSVLRHNPRGNYLDTLPKPVKPVPAPRPRQQSYGIISNYGQQYKTMQMTPMAPTSTRPDKPYVYKPRKPIDTGFRASGAFTSQRFIPMSSASPTPQPQVSSYPHYGHASHASHPGYQNQTTYSAQRFEVKGPQHYVPQQSVPQSQYPTNVSTRPVQNPFSQPMATSRSPASMQGVQRPVAPVTYHNMPATTPPASAPAPVQSRTQAKPSWHVHSSIYQKYPFFQVNHNRDSTKYRTPYSPYGGFTNGYEGNLRAHLMANKEELMRRSSILSNSPPQQSYATPAPGYHTANYNRAPGGMSQSPTTSQASSHSYPSTQAAASTPRQPAVATPKSHPHLPPAIKSQYLPTTQPLRSPSRKTPPENKPKPVPAPAPKSYKVPPKESPVPLPAGFLAAMASTTKTPASAAKAAAKTGSSISPPNATRAIYTPPAIKPVGLVPPKFADHVISTTTIASPNALPTVSPAASSPSETSTKISVTPVPIPQLPGMIQQTKVVQVPVPQEQLSKAVQAPAPLTDSKRPPALQIQTSQKHLAWTAPSQLQMGLPTKDMPQEFPDVPGGESMEFVEKLLGNLRRIS